MEEFAMAAATSLFWYVALLPLWFLGVAVIGMPIWFIARQVGLQGWITSTALGAAVAALLYVGTAAYEHLGTMMYTGRVSLAAAAGAIAGGAAGMAAWIAATLSARSRDAAR